MIVVAGEALIDRILSADDSVLEAPGGGPFNTARTIARLGLPVAFLGCLSNDRAGSVLRRALVDDGVDMSLTRSSDLPTTRAIARLDSVGNASYQFETDGTSAPELTAAAVGLALGSRPEGFHFGSLGLVLEPMATALDVGLEAAGPKTLVMLDPNCRPPAIFYRRAHLARFIRLLRRVDVVKASRDDLDFLWPDRPATDAARLILEAGSAAVVVTDGPRSVECFTGGWTLEFAVPTIEAVDAIGAGDAFGGAFLARWIERGHGRSALTDRSAMRDAIGVAIEVASLTCQRSGAHPPRRQEITWPTP